MMVRAELKDRERREQVKAKQRKQVRKAFGHWLYHFSKDVKDGMKDHKP